MTIRPTGVRRAGADLRALLGLPAGPPDLITGVTLDSRQVQAGDLYAALPGFTTHGARFGTQAASAGAAAILTDPEGEAILADAGVDAPVLVVGDPRGVLGEVSAWVYGEPAEALATTGITGTNGKTTTSFLLDAALCAGGHTTGLIGTVLARIGDEELPAVRTTPEAPDVHALLAVMRERGVTALTMEVSSHALALGRVDGIVFDLAMFTNLSQDHLDFHGDLESYFAAKASLFTPARSAAALVCVDDAWGRRLAQGAADAGLPVTTYAVSGAQADWTALEQRPGRDGSTEFDVRGPDGLRLPAAVQLPGQFNVANALGALAAAAHHGVPAEAAADAIAACPGVPGRMEHVRAGQPFLAIVDYAHTPDAVARAIAAVRETTGPDARVLTVLGCGGGRDRDKRPIMGEVAARESDVLVITDDNPRFESALAIREALMAGVQRVSRRTRAEVVVEGDRRRAIEIAAGMAGPGDAVLVLGKGHEQGQEAAGVITPFDDRVELRLALEALA